MPLTVVELVDKVTAQVITLASAILTILVTVIGWLFDYFKVQPLLVKWAIFASAVSLLVSIVFGIAVYQTLVGSLAPKKRAKSKPREVDVYKTSIRVAFLFHWVLFLIGIVGLVVTLYLLLMAA